MARRRAALGGGSADALGASAHQPCSAQRATLLAPRQSAVPAPDRIIGARQHQLPLMLPRHYQRTSATSLFSAVGTIPLMGITFTTDQSNALMMELLSAEQSLELVGQTGEFVFR